MATRKEIVDLIIRAKDESAKTIAQLSADMDRLEKSQSGAAKTSEQYQKALQALDAEADQLIAVFRELESQDRLITQFKEQSAATKKAGQEWRSLKDGVAEYRRIINESGAPTEAQTKELQRLGKAAESAGAKYQKGRRALARTSVELQEHKIAARDAAQAQIKIRDTMERSRKALERNRAALQKQKDQYRALRDSADETTPSLSALHRQLLSLAATLATVRGIVTDYADFQTGLIGVGKTAGLDGRALEEFGDQIQGLSKEIPISTKELLELAQAAGQLGVKGSKNLLQFARVMAELRASSDVKGEQGARDIVRILGITNESINQVDQFSNVLVGLGDNLAATEVEILDVATRVAQGTAAFSLSSNQVLGLSGGMKALGIQSELAGSATQKAFIQIQGAIRDGGEELEALEQITGRTREELANLFQTDQAELFEIFIAGLNRVKRSGGDVISTLEEFGIKEIRTVQVLATLSNGFTRFSQALRIAEREAKNNNARSVEAQKAFDSLTSTIEATGNAANRLGEEFGELISPAVETVLGRATRKMNSLGDAIERVNRLGREEEDATPGPFERLLLSLELIDGLAIDILFGEQIRALEALAGSAEKAGKKAAGAAAQIAEIDLSTLPGRKPAPDRKTLEANLKAQELLEQASLDRRRRINEAALQAQNISIKEYFDQRVAIEQASIDQLIRAKKRELKTSKEAAVVEAELKVLVQQRRDIELQATNEQLRAEEQLAQRKAALQDQLLAAQGNEAEARINALRRTFEQEIQAMLVNGDQAGVELARKLFNIEEARLRFEALERDFQSVMQNLRLEQEMIAQEVAIGSRSQFDATEELNRLRDDAKIKLEALVDKMRELAEASDDPRLKMGLMELQHQIDGVHSRVDSTAQDFNSKFATGFTNAFDEFISGTKSAKEAFKQFAGEFLRDIAKMLIQKAIFNAISGGSSAGGAGGLGGSLASVFHQGGVVGRSGTQSRVIPIHEFINAARFHQGGFPGGLKSDERAAILQTGEEVLSRRDPRNALNGGGQSSSVKQTIINTIDADEVVQSALQSGATDDVFINKIGQNKDQIKNILG